MGEIINDGWERDIPLSLKFCTLGTLGKVVKSDDVSGELVFFASCPAATRRYSRLGLPLLFREVFGTSDAAVAWSAPSAAVTVALVAAVAALPLSRSAEEDALLLERRRWCREWAETHA